MGRVFRSAACALALAPGGPTLAQAEELTALSDTAMSITGDVTLDDFGITFANGEALAFSALVGDAFEVSGEQVPASVHEVEAPADPVLENGNQLCGSGNVTYVANWLIPGSDTDTVIAVFDTQDVPQSDAEACATYTYEMGQ
ncbi:MAG TPA: hypothetical protein VGN97_04390 [Mesorhizobium sp.]|nr:hypothetical protein [Mesorhizobium sp.]